MCLIVRQLASVFLGKVSHAWSYSSLGKKTSCSLFPRLNFFCKINKATKDASQLGELPPALDTKQQAWFY